jgi:hypothetical protein
MTAPPVSTIIMTRCPAFVAGAIAMMRAQTYPNVEVVLGLHGLRAAELPAEGREALASADQVLELPGSQPLGTCMNMATAASQGDVIAKIDDDDLYGPRYLDEAVGHRVHASDPFAPNPGRKSALPCLGIGRKNRAFASADFFSAGLYRTIIPYA